MNVCSDGIPMPIVKLNRWILVVGIALAFVLQWPWVTTILFMLILPAALLGRRYSPVAQLGKRLFAWQNETAAKEDSRVMRFNNTIAAVLLGAAQIAFALSAPTLGWGLVLAVAVAAAVALAGFCLGCFVFYQFKLQRYRLFG